MRRDLERRLKAAEERRGGRAATIQQRIEAMSYEELMAEILACERGEPGGILDPRTMTNAELEQCIAELERLDAKAARAHEGDREAARPSGVQLRPRDGGG
jgi:hypothetical protein